MRSPSFTATSSPTGSGLPRLVVPDYVYASSLSPSADISSPESEVDSLHTPRDFFPSQALLDRSPISGKNTQDFASDSQLIALPGPEELLLPWSCSMSTSAPNSPQCDTFDPFNPLLAPRAPIEAHRTSPFTEHSRISASRNLRSPSSNNQPSFGFGSPSHHDSGIAPFFTACPLHLRSKDFTLAAHTYSPRFPSCHILNRSFVHMYCLGDELGAGGFGFVMTARHRVEGHEVAVKFIIKKKVPHHAWVEGTDIGRTPTEVLLLSYIEHKNIVRCYDVFEDRLYLYLVQELHGSPWPKRPRSSPAKSAPASPSRVCASSPSHLIINSSSPLAPRLHFPPKHPVSHACLDLEPPIQLDQKVKTTQMNNIELISAHQYQRRPSHDLFECIEQSPNKRLSEVLARHIFAQVVDALCYLDQQGITHRDIKDENIVVDKQFNVKLIDFGSAVIVDPAQPRPFYNHFFGTKAYAPPEVLLEQPYQAAPAEVWALGMLLSYLLTGATPFPTEKDAIEGRIVLNDPLEQGKSLILSSACLLLLSRCLQPDPAERADIHEVRMDQWLQL